MDWRFIAASGFNGLCLLAGVTVLVAGAGVGFGYGFTYGSRLAGIH